MPVLIDPALMTAEPYTVVLLLSLSVALARICGLKRACRELAQSNDVLRRRADDRSLAATLALDELERRPARLAPRIYSAN
jgi:hypothetical protein